ncbi:AMP-binding protein [Streptomyces sp. NPDC003442]
MIRTVEAALHGRFLRGLAASPDGTAIRTASAALGYTEAHERALALAGALLAHAGGPPGAVGVLGGKSPQTYTALLAALYAGATVVPLHPGFPAARTRRMLDLTGVSAVLADEEGLVALAPLGGPDGLDLPVLAPGLDTGAFRRLPVSARDALTEPRPAGPDDVAYILFTSGSTGRPKGVRITHGAAAHYFRLLDARYDFTPADVFSQTFDLNFDCAIFDLFCAWGAGAAVHTVPPQAYRDLPAFVAERGLTVWFSTPSAITIVRRLGGLRPAALPSLRWSFFAGEALRCSDAVDWQEAAPGALIENLYGPTELTVTVSGHRFAPDVPAAHVLNGLVPIGALHEGHDGLLLGPGGPADVATAAVGAQGELCVTGPQMTPGYLDPVDGEGRFLEHGGRRWYRTGDCVRRLDGGELAYLGRVDSQLQVQGRRVEPAEIEHALRGCPGVDDAVIVARSNDGVTELVAFYTGTPASPAGLAGELRRSLPHDLVPRYYRHLPEFPLNANRKTDRKALAERASAG